MSTEFKLPPLDEAVQRLDLLFAAAFGMDHAAMQDWIAVRFAVEGVRQAAALTEAKKAKKAGNVSRETICDD